MKTTLHRLVILAAALLLGACASPGGIREIPLQMPDGGQATIVAHNQSVPDWMLAKDKLALNFIVKGSVSAEQLAAVAAAEKACRLYTGTVRPNDVVSVFANGALYGIAGYIGGGVGSQAFPHAVFSQYARYSGYATGLGGLANGIVSLGGQTYTFESCGREVFGLFPEYRVRILMKSPY